MGSVKHQKRKERMDGSVHLQTLSSVALQTTQKERVRRYRVRVLRREVRLPNVRDNHPFYISTRPGLKKTRISHHRFNYPTPLDNLFFHACMDVMTNACVTYSCVDKSIYITKIVVGGTMGLVSLRDN